ncbi:MAG: hypothetical protein ACI9QC_000126 [Oceanicoccus sp.]|jgi:hypothetical protein
MKRLLALVTMFSMLLVPLSQATSSYGSDWYWSSYDTEMDWMTTNAIMTANDEGAFRPEDCANRAEFVKVLYSMKGGMQNSSSEFTDVPEGAWFEAYVGTALEDGIVIGFEDGTFRPSQCVTRAEGVKMAMTAFADLLPAEDPIFADYVAYSDINESDWFYDTLSWALNIEVVGGNHVIWSESLVSSEAWFYPNDSMSREEVAALFYRIQAVIDNDAEYYDFWTVPNPMGELFTNACSIDKSDVVKGVPLEWAMSESSDFVLKVDGTNRGQLRQFAKHVDEIGGGEVWSMLIDQYDWAVADELSYEELGEEIIMDDWQIGLSWETGESIEGDFALSFSVDQFNEFQHIVANSMWDSYGANIECESYELYTMWTVEWDDLYVLRYGDLFVFANSNAHREALLDQILAEDGFDEIKSDSLVYGWVDLESSLEAYTDLLGLADLNFDDIKELEFTLEASTDGFRFVSDSSFSSDESEILMAYSDQDLELVDRVPAGDLMMYMEDQDLSLIVDRLFDFYAPGERLYQSLEDEFGFDSETLQLLTESGYAFTVADSGGLVPDTAFYLHLTHRDEKALAAELTLELDSLMEELVTDIVYNWNSETQVYDEEEVTYFVQDVSVSGDVSKWDLDQSQFDGDEVSLYYGLIEEDVYAIAFYDDFINAWGDESVEDLRRFELAAKNIDHNTAAQVQFIDFASMVPWMETWVEYTAGTYDEASYNEASAWLDRLGVFYGSTYVTDKDVLHQELFWNL